MITRPPHRSSATRGFTLVELMVAVTGGLFVSIAVFLLAKHSTAFYQAEARIGNATFSQITGFDRLRADIARAGYLVTPNIVRDPAICGNPAGGGWPLWLSRLASVFIDAVPAAEVPPVLTRNGRAPERITLAGSYSLNDQFETGPIIANAGNNTIHLRHNSPAMVRLGYNIGGANNQNILDTAFPAGRVLRIVDKTGREQYGIIASTDAATATEPFIVIGNVPPLQFRAGNALRCGINDLGVGSLVNVVNIIRYTVRAPSTGLFQRVVGTGTAGAPNAPSTDVERTELIREELNPTTGTAFAGTEELVAEYAVDLQFGISAATTINQVNGVWDQTALTTFPPGNAGVANFAGNPTTLAAGTGPHLIRSVRARLSIRSREADREGDVLTGTALGVAPGFYRIGLGPAGAAGAAGDATPPFARVRTAQADIALRNQLGVMWP